MFNRKLYSRWYDIIRRCYNPNRIGFENYGGRGIKVCDEWLEYHNFQKWSMENGFIECLEIDRIDNNANYSPDNCRWISRKQNSLNKRNNVNIDGVVLSELSEISGLRYESLRVKCKRLKKKGVQLNKDNVLTDYNEKNKVRIEGMTFKEISEKHNIPIEKIRNRYNNLVRAKKAINIDSLISSDKIGMHLVEGKTLKEISSLYSIPYNTLRSRAYTINKLGIPMTIDNLLNIKNIYTICQSITTSN